MKFDVPTLMAAGAFMTAVSSLLLGLSWLADRRAGALLWWAAGNLLMAVGIFFLFIFSDAPGPELAIAALLLTAGPALVWTATRTFQGRKPAYLAIAVGPLCLIVIGFLTHDAGINMAANLGLAAAYFAAAAAELLRHRPVRLRMRWPLAVFLLIHALLFAAGTVEAASSLFPASELIPFGIVFGTIHFEQLIFALASSIFLVALVREESELRHKTAARIDMLTGVASRRAFLELAASAMVRSEEEEAPFSLVIFDLDRFKQINDTYGHAAGDHVLQLFGQTATSKLRRGDIIGRLGGEEFAIAMPGVSPEAAFVVADRIRQAFSTSGFTINDGMVPTTSSAGVAIAEPGKTLDDVIERADAALYRAKTLGRDRVEAAARSRTQPASTVIRVA